MHQASPTVRHPDRIHDALCRCDRCKPAFQYDDPRAGRVWVAIVTFFLGFGFVGVLASFA